MTDVTTLPDGASADLLGGYFYFWVPGTPATQFKAPITDISDVIAATGEWSPNFTSDGDVYIPAHVAMTIDQGNPKIGTGTITFAKSTAATPGTFTTTTLPVDLQAGAWLKVSATSVAGFCATHLTRTA